MSYEGPGIYRHYKGGDYRVLGKALIEASKGDDPEIVVIYEPLTAGSLLEGTDISFWSRPLDNFDEDVNIDPGLEHESADMPAPVVPRFKLLQKTGAHLPLGAILQAEIGHLPGSIIQALEGDGTLNPATKVALIDLVRVVRGIKDAFVAHLGELDLSNAGIDSGDAPTLKSP